MTKVLDFSLQMYIHGDTISRHPRQPQYTELRAKSGMTNYALVHHLNYKNTLGILCKILK
jgi:hypothetical protein